MKENIVKSRMSEKENMLIMMMELCGDEDEERGTETWTNAVDRGGLWHISDETYMVFLIMECEIRHHLNTSKMAELHDDTKKVILDAITSNEELLFQWAILSSSASDSVGKEVLKVIVFNGQRFWFCHILFGDV